MMRLRRSLAWAVAGLALLAHLAAGVASPGTQLCVCSAGVTIAPQHAACCGIEDAAPGGAAAACTDCHIIPMPADDAGAIAPAPGQPPDAAMPARARIAAIVWPAPPRPRLRGHPPDPVPRLLRTMLLTC